MISASGIPRDFKGGLRSLTTTVGFKGFKLSELTPNITRRAQVVNWIIYFREKLFGKSIADLMTERQRELPLAADIEVLPSQKQYQSNRID